MQKMRAGSLGWEDLLEKGMATQPVFLPRESNGQRSLEGYSLWGCKESDMTEHVCACAHTRTHTHTHTHAHWHSSTLASKIPWTEEPGRLWSMVSQRVRHDWGTTKQTNKILSLFLMDVIHRMDLILSPYLIWDSRSNTWWITAFLKQFLYFLNPTFSLLPLTLLLVLYSLLLVLYRRGPHLQAMDQYLQVSSGIQLEIKYTINVMHLNHPEIIHTTPDPGKNCLPWKRSLVPRRLGTTPV